MNSNAIICLEFSGNWFDYSVSDLSRTDKSNDWSGFQISTRNHCFDWEQRYYSFKSLQYVFRTFHLVLWEQTVASLFPTIIYTEYFSAIYNTTRTTTRNSASTCITRSMIKNWDQNKLLSSGNNNWTKWHSILTKKISEARNEGANVSWNYFSWNYLKF